MNEEELIALLRKELKIEIDEVHDFDSRRVEVKLKLGTTVVSESSYVVEFTYND